MEKRTVLFVDDEEKILRSLKRGLMDELYESLFANNGQEALEILQQNEVHVLVTDMHMSEMNGLELLKIVKLNYPHIVRMVLTGAHQSSLARELNEVGTYKFLICTKPWKLEEELKPAVREALNYYDRHSKSKMLVDELE